MEKSKKSSFIKSHLLYLISFVAVAFIAVIMPFSHAMDSSVISDIVNRNLEITGWNAFYMNFYANNKLVAYFYFVFYKLFGGNLALAVKFVNFLSTYATIFFVSKAIKETLGQNKEGIAIIVCTIIFPYFINFGPYIYNLSIPLSAICFYLSLYKDKKHFVPFLFLLSLLLFVRITAAIFIYVFLMLRCIVQNYDRHINIKIFVCCLIVLVISNFVWGAAAYITGLHKYPNFTNSATQWTLYLGTRYDGENTGWCIYQPEVANPPNDPIIQNFNKLTSLYSENNKDNYKQIKELNAQINKQLIERGKATSFSSINSFTKFFTAKAKNLFDAGDKEIYYYYGTHMSNPSVSEELKYNVQADVKTLFVIFLYVFFAAVAWLVLMYFFAKNTPAENSSVWSCVLGFIATCLVFILFTEVAKRYLLDAAVPMLFVIVAAACTIKSKHVRWIGEGMFIAAVATLLAKNNIDLPKFHFEVEQQSNQIVLTIITKEEFNDEFSLQVSNQNSPHKIKNGEQITVPNGTQLIFNFGDKRRVIYK